MTYQNELLLDVLRRKEVPRPPVWVMRQAGRILPGYREIRSGVKSFKHLVKQTDLIAQVTAEPVDVLGVDAAILFSDILVIPEAMGVDYEIIEKKGPVFEDPVKDPGDIQRLQFGKDVLPSLDYVFTSIEKTKKVLDDRVPLIGFAGAPWTLFAYMIEGSGSKTFAKARRFMYEHPKATHELMEKISLSISYYVQEKVNRGCDAIQIFDSWAEMLTIRQYEEFCLPYLKMIFESIEGTPSIFFPKGAWSVIPKLRDLTFDAISIDWKTPIDYVRTHLGAEQIVQGNIDPAMLYASQTEIQGEVQRVFLSAGKNHIFNLGHGVYPDTRADNVKVMIDAIKACNY